MTARRSAIGKQALEAGPDRQECQVKPLKTGEHPTRPRRQSQRAQQWQRSPHRRKGGSPRQHMPILAGMEAPQQFGAVDRTRCRRCVRNFDEINRTVPVEPPHKRNFTPAKRATSIVPDSKFGHAADVGTLCQSTPLIGAPDRDFPVRLVWSLTSQALFADNLDTSPFRLLSPVTDGNERE